MPDHATTCGKCGMANPPGNNYCGRCGTFLNTDARDLSERVPRQPADMPGHPADAPGDPRARRQVRVIYAITAFFVLSCLVLAVVVVVWRP